MYVAGIDCSTHAIDVVMLDLDTDDATWDRFDMAVGDLLDRIHSIRHWWNPRGAIWDDCLAIGIERPSGRHPGSMAATNMTVGAVISRLPATRLIKFWSPGEWRKAVGLKGNCTKDEVTEWALQHALAAGPEGWPQDACDAYTIAYAMRHSIEVVPDTNTPKTQEEPCHS